MDNFLRMVASSLRRLTKAPGFTALVIIPLTIGIGANTSLFSIFYSVLLRPLPYNNPEQLVSIWETFPQAPLEHSDISPPNYFDLAQKSRSFSQIGAATPYWSVYLTGVSEPDVAVTVTGHLHTALPQPLIQDGRLLVREKGYAEELGRLELKVDDPELGDDT